jgi:hypothetical protein
MLRQKMFPSGLAFFVFLASAAVLSTLVVATLDILACRA